MATPIRSKDREKEIRKKRGEKKERRSWTMDEEARPRQAMSSQFSRFVPSEEGLKRLPRLREREMDRSRRRRRRSCEENDHAEFSFETITSLVGTAR